MEFLRDSHTEHAKVKKLFHNPFWNVLLLINFMRWMFGLEICIESCKQFIAALSLFLRTLGIWKEQVLSKCSPKSILHHAHRGRIWSEHFLRSFDLLAIVGGNVLQVVGKICTVCRRHKNSVCAFERNRTIAYLTIKMGNVLMRSAEAKLTQPAGLRNCASFSRAAEV